MLHHKKERMFLLLEVDVLSIVATGSEYVDFSITNTGVVSNSLSSLVQSREKNRPYVDYPYSE